MALHRRIVPGVFDSAASPSLCPADCFLPCILPGRYPLPPFSLPPPPPPPPPADLHHSRLTNNLLLAFSLLGAASFLLLVFYAVVRRRRSRRADPSSSPASDAEDGAGALFHGGDDDSVHHVWYIRTVGLDEATIASIAVAEYQTGAGLLGAADCSVCLGEFHDGDLVRLLPKCGHAFHAPCIDTWLRAHVSCPLCRADIVDPAGELALAGSSGTSVEELGSAASLETIEIDMASPGRSTGELEPAPLPPPPEEEGDRRDTMIAQVGVLALPAERSLMGALMNLGESGLQPVRRSASMNSPFIGTGEDVAAMEEGITQSGKEPTAQEEQSGKEKEKHENPSKGLLQIRRSLSSSGWAFLSSRNGRSRSSIVPL